jgi:hypothetical protein
VVAMPKGVYPHTHIKPKVYSAELVERVRSLYAEGRTQAEIAAEVGSTQKVIWRLMANHSIGARVAAKREQAGAANHMWSGDEAGYQALHLRVETARGKPTECQRCGLIDPASRYEWANLTGNYQDIEDYERMCVSCHRRYDAQRRAVTGEPTSPARRSA